MIDPPEPEKNAHRATQGLDPDQVDTDTPDVNPDPDTCQTVETTGRDGQPITFTVRTVAGLTPAEQAQLGAIAKVVADRTLRDDPHAGVITQLMTTSLRAQVALRGGGKSDRADRLSAAVKAAVEVILAARGDRASRFAWAEEAGRLDAHVQELHADLAAAVADLRATTELAARLVPLLGAATLSDEGRAELEEIATGLLPLRMSAPVGWSCTCGTDETDMVHTTERCYSASEPVPNAVSETTTGGDL